MIGVVSALGVMVMTGVGPGLPIPSEAFGQHVAQIAQAWPTDLPATSIRLWDAGVRWNQIEPQQGRFNWAPLDAAVENTQAAGVTDILYVLGSTPRWAARNPDLPGLYGPGTTSLPSDLEYYLDFVRAVVQRYQGRITGYQIWNEANTRSFYEGDWTALAQLTKRTYDTVKLLDPSAQVVAASSTVIPGRPFQRESFFVRYAKALRARGTPVDAMAVHLYPVDTTQGPDARAQSIAAVQRALDRLGINRPVWDTEVAYGDRRPGLPRVVPDEQTAATYVARTFIDAATLGIARTYWYGWDIGVLGIDMTSPTGVTPAGRAFLTVRDWLTDARPAGCQDVGTVRRCQFTAADGSAFAIAWGQGQIDASGLQVCRLDGTCADGGVTMVDAQPVLLR